MSTPDRWDLAELATLQDLVAGSAGQLQSWSLGEVRVEGRTFPLQAYALGPDRQDVPAVGFFGGVHGLERIGSEVVIAYMRSLVGRLAWDEVLRLQLERVRLIFMPVVNPGGVWLGTRANPAGVDLMRNAPVEAVDRVPFWVGGQQWSAALPWYRGAFGAPMEPEAAALCGLVERELLGRSFALALDCHSGFGVNDRIWFPHAHTATPIEHLPELLALKGLIDDAIPHHAYLLEPQSRHYLAHGDLWDHLYLQSQSRRDGLFLPLTLEMGSWLWVKKNPRQLFNRHGLFNPLIHHRQHRVLRRHLTCMDTLVRAAIGHARWCPEPSRREPLRCQALDLWYTRHPCP